MKLPRLPYTDVQMPWAQEMRRKGLLTLLTYVDGHFRHPASGDTYTSMYDVGEADRS